MSIAQEYGDHIRYYIAMVWFADARPGTVPPRLGFKCL
jgi:hypothetical protein